MREDVIENNMTNIPLVTVCCLTYNHADYIVQTLDGILNQKTTFPYEVIVHDDASTDGTSDIIRRYEKKYPDIVVPIIQTENQFFKYNLAKQYVNPKARGKYIAICEGDDYWTDTTKLQKQVEYMEAHPECTMTFHAIEQLNSDGSVIKYHPLKESCVVSPECIIKRGGMFCPSVSLVIRRDICENWPKFRELAKVYDFPIQILSAINGKVYYFHEEMGVYRYGATGSWTEAHNEKTDYAHMQNEEEWLRLFNEYSNNQYEYEVNYHLARIWLVEYQKNLNIINYKNARKYVKMLSRKDALIINLRLLFFRVGKRKAQRIFALLKK